MESRMLKRLAAYLFLTAVPGAVQPLVAQDFEGVVRQRTIEVYLDALADQGLDVSSALFEISIDEILALRSRLEADGSMTVSEDEILIKGHLMRMDASDQESGPGYATIDLRAGVTRMVSLDEGMYIEVTRADLEQMGGFGGEFESDPPTVTETGRTRTINGMNATAYEVSSSDGESLIWVSNDDPELTRSFGQLVEGVSSMSMEDAADPAVMVLEYGVPVLVQALDYDMYRIEEVMSVDRRSVSGDAFDPPTGLQRMTMQDMMGGAMPLGGGAAESESLGILGALSEMESPPAWVEYEVSGGWDVSGREDDVVMCSGTEDGFMGRSLGDVIIDLEADGPGDGRHEMSIYVADMTGRRFEGRGVLTVRPTGEESFGFPIYDVEFEGAGLESRDGGVLSVRGTMACAGM
jgi:hypothetical protein